MNEAYTHLAQFYDRLMSEDYEAWAEYLLSIAAREGLQPRRALDIGCGTGSISAALAERGLEVLGVDISPEMVTYAREKARSCGGAVSFVVQDMRALRLPVAGWELAVAACDAMNYLVTAEDFRQTLQAVAGHLRPGGLFLFDLNSEAKLREVYGCNSYADLFEDFAYFWDNCYDEASRTCTMELTFFVPDSDGTYRRVEERHVQRLWYPHEAASFLTEAGFEYLGCWEFPTFDPPTEDTQRWQFIARKALRP